MMNPTPGPRLPYLDWYQTLLVEKAADTFIELVCAVWKLDQIPPEMLSHLKAGLMEHFAEAFETAAVDDCWDNPEDFVWPV